MLTHPLIHAFLVCSVTPTYSHFPECDLQEVGQGRKLVFAPPSLDAEKNVLSVLLNEKSIAK